MTAKEYREKTVEELNEALLELRKEQFSLRMQSKTGQMAQTHFFKKVKKDIARIKTVLTEKATKS